MTCSNMMMIWMEWKKQGTLKDSHKQLKYFPFNVIPNKYYCNVMECFKVPIYKNLLTMFLIYYHYRHRESTSRSRSRSPVRRSRSRSRSHERHRDRARRINLISKRVIISNVPYEMKWQDIKDIFRKEGITK